MTITVVPQEFTKVEFDAARVAELALEALALVDGVADDADVEIRIDEEQATSRFAIVQLDPLVFAVDGGAFEDYKDPRRMGDGATRETLVRLLLEAVDRLNPAFGAPTLDAEVTQAHKQAWDVNLYGRVAGLGLPLHQPRFRYNFRNRHGFSDVADRIFDQLWASDTMSWAEITTASDRATDVVIT